MLGLASATISILLAAPLARAEEGSIELKTVGEKEIRIVDESGEERIKRVPASLVTPGEEVVYSIYASNVGTEPAENVVVTDPIPKNMTYRGGTASGDGTEITFSVDQGKTYDAPENLIVLDEDGTPKQAEPGDYTHIRWHRAGPLAPGETQRLEFRARLD
jgi:uncharacterized repeat protein (TIGR01451 family)